LVAVIDSVLPVTPEISHFFVHAPRYAKINHAQTRRRFRLPVFDRPVEDPPRRVPYEVAVRAFEEIIVALKLRENTPRVAEDIPEFKM
jgi:hypothetical protein